jgi:hypothetical protein
MVHFIVLIHHSHGYQRNKGKTSPHYNQRYTNKGKGCLEDVQDVTVHLTSLFIYFILPAFYGISRSA